MIPKIICKIFGHIKTYAIFTGETADITNRLTGKLMTVPVCIEKRYKKCPRCGVSL